MSLDPQAAAYLRRQAELGVPPTSDLTPAEARRLMEEGTVVNWGELEPIPRVRDEVVGGPDPDLRGRAGQSGADPSLDARRWLGVRFA